MNQAAPIKAFEIRKLCWMIRVGPKYDHKCLQKRKSEDLTAEHAESGATWKQGVRGVWGIA